MKNKGPDCTVKFEDDWSYLSDAFIFPRSIILSDLNNDDQIDIGFTEIWTNDLIILLAQGNRTFSFEIRNSMSFYYFTLENLLISDINNDGKLDIVVFDVYFGCLGVLFGNGDGTFQMEPIITYVLLTNTLLFPIAITHLNNDTYLDIVLIDSLSRMCIYTGDGSGMFLLETILNIGTFNSIQSISTYDLNNDGYQDISIIDSINRYIGFFFGYGNLTFEPLKTVFTGGNLSPNSMLLADFNNDTLLDIFIGYYSNKLRLLLDSTNETFEITKLIYLNESSEIRLISTNDLNKDGHLDILIDMSLSYGIYILYGDGHGHFSIETSFLIDIPSALTWANVADFNNDGYEDILILEQISGQMIIFFNTNNCNSN